MAKQTRITRDDVERLVRLREEAWANWPDMAPMNAYTNACYGMQDVLIEAARMLNADELTYTRPREKQQCLQCGKWFRADQFEELAQPCRGAVVRLRCPHCSHVHETER